MSVNKSIAKASIILILGNATGYLLGFVKEILVAANYGVTAQMDAFYAGITIPSLITNILLATFMAIFIPVFLNYEAKDKLESLKLANITINYILVFLFIGTGLIFFGAHYIIKWVFPGFTEETAILSTGLLQQVSLVVLFSGIVGVASGILNAQKYFAAPAFSPILVTAMVIIFIVFLKQKLEIASLTYGLVAGTFIQAVFLIILLFKKGYRHQFNFNYQHPGLEQIRKLMVPFLIGTALGQLNIVVDRFMASSLTHGSVAALGYADKLVHVPIQIFNVSIATAAFPFFASQVAAKEIENLKQTVASTVRMAAFILIPTTFILIALSEPLIRLCFERGAFTAEATALTSKIFTLYSLQLFFTAIEVLLIRVFFALQNVVVLVKIVILSLILKVIFNLVFIRLITPPAAGIALATSLVEAVIMFLVFYMLKTRIGPLSGRYILDGTKKIALASLIAGAMLFLIYNMLNQNWMRTNILNQLITVSGLGMIGLAIFLGICKYQKLEEMSKLKSMLFKLDELIKGI